MQLANVVLVRLDVRDGRAAAPRGARDETGETATLSVAGDPDAVTIDFVAARHYVQGVTQLGRPSVAHATAAGKVMLAFTERHPRPPLRAYTDRTITDPAALDAELEQIRRRGCGAAYEERERELNAIAAPVFANDGTLAGVVALQGPVPRFGRAPARKALSALLAARRRSRARSELRSGLTPGIQLVPASGTRAIAAASTVSATRSSGSRLWTWDLPQARASVCVSRVRTRR